MNAPVLPTHFAQPIAETTTTTAANTAPLPPFRPTTHITSPLLSLTPRAPQPYNLQTPIPRRSLYQAHLSASLPPNRHLRPAQSLLARLPPQARPRTAETKLHTQDRCRILRIRWRRSEKDHGEEEGPLGV